MEIGEIQEVKHLIVCLSMILALSAVSPFAEEPVFAAVLPKIPDEATAITLDGKTVSITDHRGKLIFLTVWRTDCKACLFEQTAHDPLCGRRAADVAHTDEADGVHSGRHAPHRTTPRNRVACCPVT